MGTANFDLVHALWSGLPHRQFRMLAFMARTALDDVSPSGQAPRMYFGSHNKLALAIGQCPPDQPEPDDCSDEAELARRQRHAALEQVRRDLRALEAAGAIECVRKASRDRMTSPTYRLNLDEVGLIGRGRRTEMVRSHRTEMVRSTHRPGEPGAPSGGARLQGLSSLPDTTSTHGRLPTERTEDRHPARDGSDDDERYLTAKKALEAIGPDAYGRALAAVRALHPAASTRESVILAAAHIEAGAA